MGGICSRHHPDTVVSSCRACNSTPHGLFPDWDESVARAKAAGLFTCYVCAFDYYATTNRCPLCGLPLSQTQTGVVDQAETQAAFHSRTHALGWTKRGGLPPSEDEVDRLLTTYRRALWGGFRDPGEVVLGAIKGLRSGAQGGT